MNKEKLKQELRLEILDSIMSNDLIDKIADKVIFRLPPSIKNEILLHKYSEAYGKRESKPDFNLESIEDKAKEIEQFNKQHSALTPPKPRDFEKELEGRRKAIESIQEEHSD